jgi:hypothetical protein
VSLEENWQAGEKPMDAPAGENVGTMEYWQAAEQPPVWFGEEDGVVGVGLSALTGLSGLSAIMGET